MRRTRLANRVLLTGAASTALAALLAGCGHTVSVGSARTLRMAVTEYRVIPQSVLAEPGELTLIVSNDGRLTHNLAVTTGSGKVLDATPPIAPGQTSELIVSLPRGSYVIASTLFSDQALGTYGSLTVGS